MAQLNGVQERETCYERPKQISYGSLLTKNAQLLANQHHLISHGSRTLSVVHGDLSRLKDKVRNYIEDKARLCQPDNLHICDGSEAENDYLLNLMQKQGMIVPLAKYENCWLARTDPADVARVESLTFMSTPNKQDTVPIPKEGVRGMLGNWLSPSDMEKSFSERFPGCMKGRTMYVIPFSMGPIGSPLSKIGIQLTDSPYVVVCMRIMTRMGSLVLKTLGEADFVKCLHSVGQPLPTKVPPKNNWPCNPQKTIIAHIPDNNEICSFGSGYGGNSLLGKKCFALRIGSILAKREGWLAEHMLILGITNPKGQKKYIVAAFPSACGKTNLAMMNPSLPGYKVECVGDDICWMRFDEFGQLRAINPEYGFFGVAPGTSMKTNPNAMLTVQKNTVFTNVAETSDGGFFWEGLEKEIPDGVKIKSWLGMENWTPEVGKPSAHPNSRFCSPAKQCPIMDPAWEDPDGVPVSAIVFGGRRPKGVPLVFEALNWKHGVFIGAAMRSEATAAAEHKGKVIMHDPFAMRPFFGYNFGHYLNHWLSFAEKPGLKLPRVFHVNWFRKDEEGKFLWPGFGENSRVLDWICRRVDGDDIAQIRYRMWTGSSGNTRKRRFMEVYWSKLLRMACDQEDRTDLRNQVETPIGYIPKPGSLNMDGLKESVNVEALFHLPKEFWLQECKEINKYLSEQLDKDLPSDISEELHKLETRVSKM